MGAGHSGIANGRGVTAAAAEIKSAVSEIGNISSLTDKAVRSLKNAKPPDLNLTDYPPIEDEEGEPLYAPEDWEFDKRTDHDIRALKKELAEFRALKMNFQKHINVMQGHQDTFNAIPPKVLLLMLKDLGEFIGAMDETTKSGLLRIIKSDVFKKIAQTLPLIIEKHSDILDIMQEDETIGFIIQLFRKYKLSEMVTNVKNTMPSVKNLEDIQAVAEEINSLVAVRKRNKILLDAELERLYKKRAGENAEQTVESEYDYNYGDVDDNKKPMGEGSIDYILGQDREPVEPYTSGSGGRGGGDAFLREEFSDGPIHREGRKAGTWTRSRQGAVSSSGSGSGRSPGSGPGLGPNSPEGFDPLGRSHLFTPLR